MSIKWEHPENVPISVQTPTQLSVSNYYGTANACVQQKQTASNAVERNNCDRLSAKVQLEWLSQQRESAPITSSDKPCQAAHEALGLGIKTAEKNSIACAEAWSYMPRVMIQETENNATRHCFHSAYHWWQRYKTKYLNINYQEIPYHITKQAKTNMNVWLQYYITMSIRILGRCWYHTYDS